MELRYTALRKGFKKKRRILMEVTFNKLTKEQQDDVISRTFHQSI